MSNGIKEMSKAFVLIFLFAVPGKAAILWYEWQKVGGEENMPGITAYPLGFSVFDGKADIGAQFAISNTVGLDLGIQSSSPFSCVGFYVGPRYSFKSEKIGISSRVNLTVLVFNVFLAHELIEENEIK